MALPIGCTPILKGKEATDFVQRIKKEQTDVRPLVPTPKLESIRRLILKDARNGEK
ncbi:MAG TPA: hypothetical protein VMT62_02070 [Syntrophorhabdaceae bacterium]|nr:hypothetical protein [Syntrophorhabdaceae bacterium]